MKNRALRTVVVLAALTLVASALPAQRGDRPPGDRPPESDRPESDRPHRGECVDVEILSSPEKATAGEVLRVEGSITNCGVEVRGIVVTWLLVDQQGDPTILGRRVAHVAPGETIAGAVHLLVPDDQKPGKQRLTLVGRTPHRAGDRDSARIIIVPSPGGESGDD